MGPISRATAGSRGDRIPDSRPLVGDGPATPGASETSGDLNYVQHCVSRHGADRVGGGALDLKGPGRASRWAGKTVEHGQLIAASVPRGGSGHVHAVDAAIGGHLWTFDNGPGGDEPRAETWPEGPPTRDESSWTTITVEPAARLLYVAVGNVYPDLDNRDRPGDNRHTGPIVTLDADTGRLRW